MRRLRDAVGARYDRLTERRRRWSEQLDEVSLGGAERLYRRADALIARAFRQETCPVPAATVSGALTIDVVDDLVAYTQLSRQVVERLISRREPLSFRSEWYGTPPELRADHWYYLASKSYLFGNASHFTGTHELDLIAAAIPDGSTILDFGGGTGSLALALVARGHRVWVDELNALQRDFLRFRVDRHGLADRLTVVDPWTDVPAAAFDAVTAFDVFEHMPDGRVVLEQRLLPALRETGVLVEDSPFVRNASNPMHHADWGLAGVLESRGFAVVRREGHARVWARGQG